MNEIPSWAALLIGGTSALAQTASPAPTAKEQALSERLTAEINYSISCNTSFIALKEQLQAANAKIVEMEKAKAAADPKNKK